MTCSLWRSDRIPWCRQMEVLQSSVIDKAVLAVQHDVEVCENRFLQNGGESRGAAQGCCHGTSSVESGRYLTFAVN